MRSRSYREIFVIAGSSWTTCLRLAPLSHSRNSDQAPFTGNISQSLRESAATRKLPSTRFTRPAALPLDGIPLTATLHIMISRSHQFEIQTRGNNDVLNITERVDRCAVEDGITSGIATVFVVGSTAGITTTEYEPGLVNHDLKARLETIAPEDGHYVHEQTWHDDNGHSHVRASLVGPSLTVPIVDGQLTLGTWQQIVLLDFDTRGRNRRVIVQILGE